MLADFAVLSGDLLQLPDGMTGRLAVIKTVVGGAVVAEQ